MSYKIRWMNKESGHNGIGKVLTKEINKKGAVKTYRKPLNFDEAEKLCIYANENYTKARHFVVTV